MILYIGNKLSKHGNTPTSVETLGKLLAEDFDILSVSGKKNKPLRLLDMVWSVVRDRKRISFVLIDTYSTSNFYYALLCAFAAKLLDLKYIPILHGGNLPKRLIDSPKLTKFMFGNAYMNVAPSGYLQDAFVKEGYDVTYIPNNIELKNYQFKCRYVLRPKLLYVRAFSALYNPGLALDVLQKLLKKFPDVTLCMVGPDRDGTFEKTREKCKAMGLEDKVTFTGKMEKVDWWELSKEYDIFINTTNFDNTPVSLMEAMALGLPVVTTNVGGIPYLVDDGVDALLVAPDNAEAMSEKIDLLLSNSVLAQSITENARKKVESFDWQTIKQQWFTLLKGEK